MALFDSLINEVSTKFGLGAQARPLVSEALQLMTGDSGGIAGFLDRFRSAGLGPQVASWMGSTSGTAIPAQSIESALGSNTLSRIAGRLGLQTATVTAALGFIIPKMIGYLTPGGKVPTTVPPEVSSFLRPVEQVAPRSMQVLHDQPHMMGWLWPALAALAVLGLGAYFLLGRTPTPVAPVAVQTPVAPPVAAAPTLPPRLALGNDNGVVRYSGSVHDEDTRTSIINSLKAVFGADRVQGDVAVDPNRGAASWLTNFRAGLESLKTSGVQAVFDGNSVNLGGVIGDADRDRIANSMKTALGGSLVFGTLADKVTEWATGANTKVAAALTSLRSGFTANDLVGILNQSIINFPSGSAEVPAASAGLLQNAAAQIKQLPSGTVLEIAGYTDNIGDTAANVALSQQRADAVRKVLIQAGVEPTMLIAKGYGAANPIASNDLLEGRFRNRRIEYHVLQS